MNERQTLLAYTSMSQETRLETGDLLAWTGPDGMAAGAIAQGSEVSALSVSLRLKEPERAGLVAPRRDSRSIVYRAENGAASGLIRLVMEDRCADRTENCVPAIVRSFAGAAFET